MTVTILTGDCRDVLAGMPADSLDASVTDPPYGLNFMGKGWDKGVPGVDFWIEVFRVLKPGAHLLAFGGTRTYHRMVCAIEDAGFEVRDCIFWCYGSGFPKSHNLDGDREGWGTAIKPAVEPIVVARKPLIGTVAANVLAHGTGALNIDGCRVEGTEDTARAQGKDIRGGQWSGNGGRSDLTTGGGTGRWPANLVHDGSDEVLAAFPSPHGAGAKRQAEDGTHGGKSGMFGLGEAAMRFGDSGSAARFFYCAKASKTERGEGNTHPTVKPLALMRWLCRLVTPPGGTVLDPFAGSGTTGLAATLEQFQSVLIEADADHAEIIKARVARSNEAAPLLAGGLL